MALERLAPLGDEGSEPSPPIKKAPGKPKTQPTRQPTAQPTQGPGSWGDSAERYVAEQGLKSPRKAGNANKASNANKVSRAGKTWPTREEREARAEAKGQARAEEIAKDPTGYARQVCLQLLEYGPRTRKELADALVNKGVPEDAAHEVLGRFTEVGIIDDALFAGLWVSSRHRGRGLAGRALSQELRRKGIDDETAREAVAQLDPDEEAQTARSLVRRKLPATRGLATEARVRRLAGMLARKGYGGGLAFRIVKEELDAEGTDTGALVIDTDGLSALD